MSTFLNLLKGLFLFFCVPYFMEAEENDRIKLNIEFVQCFLPY